MDKRRNQNKNKANIQNSKMKKGQQESENKYEYQTAVEGTVSANSIQNRGVPPFNPRRHPLSVRGASVARAVAFAACRRRSATAPVGINAAPRGSR